SRRKASSPSQAVSRNALTWPGSCSSAARKISSIVWNRAGVIGERRALYSIQRGLATLTFTYNILRPSPFREALERARGRASISTGLLRLKAFANQSCCDRELF